MLHDRPTTDGGSQVGYVTSFMYSPVLQRHIGLARVRPDLAAPGTEVHIELAINHHNTTVLARTARAAPVQPREEDGQAMNNEYDAIVVGGGHNGLVNAGYLAKAGLRTLVLEKRDLVGGAAITEELVPGFSFTTFSYALSLLRPEIIQELDLVEHGFMPLMMPSSFHPTGDGDYLLLGDDHGQNIQEIRRHSPHDADAYDRYHHDLDRVVPGDPAAVRQRRRRTSSARTPRTRPTSRGCSTTSAGSSRR